MNFEILIDEMLDVAKNKPTGFTTFLDGSIPTRGFVVAYLETQNCFEREGLKKCILHAIDHDGLLGGWTNQEGRLQFDSCKIISELNEAIEFGRAQKQISIYYLDKFCEIIL